VLSFRVLQSFHDHCLTSPLPAAAAAPPRARTTMSFRCRMRAR
jgi:hypothetical protein